MASAELYQRLMESFCRREAVKALGLNPSKDAVTRRTQDHLDRLEITALSMFNRGRQDIGEQELSADLAVLDPELLERSWPTQTGIRIIGEFFFVHAPEARVLAGPTAASTDEAAGADGTARPDGHADRETPRESPRRSYEFLHATFGEYLVASRVMSELVEAADKSFAGRRRRTEPVDDLLYALLTHQALAARLPTLSFAGEIFATMSGKDRERVLAVLELLLGGYRNRKGTITYAGYRPTAADTVRELAFYSANLIALRAWLEPDHGVIPLPTLLGRDAAAERTAENGRPAGTARLTGTRRSGDQTREAADGYLERWRSMVMLWKSGLDVDGLLAMLSTVELAGDSGIQVSDLVDMATRETDSFTVDHDDDIFLARLAGERELTERIRYGTAVVEERLVSFYDTPWRDQMVSWLVPAISGRAAGFSADPPPAGTSAADIEYVADLILRCLRSDEFGGHQPGALLKLLFSLPPTVKLDPFALTVVAVSRPDLLKLFPELRSPDIYGKYLPFVSGLNPETDRKEIVHDALWAGQLILRRIISDRS